MSDGSTLGKTTKRIAAVCSLISGAFAAFWLVQILRDEVPADQFSVVVINVLNFALLACAFGWMSRRREMSYRSTLGFFIASPMFAMWAARFVWQPSSKHHDFGTAGLVTFAVAVGLSVVAVLVHTRRRRSVAVTE